MQVDRSWSVFRFRGEEVFVVNTSKISRIRPELVELQSYNNYCLYCSDTAGIIISSFVPIEYSHLKMRICLIAFPQICV